jgi:hypothetical protein
MQESGLSEREVGVSARESRGRRREICLRSSRLGERVAFFWYERRIFAAVVGENCHGDRRTEFPGFFSAA